MLRIEGRTTVIKTLFIFGSGTFGAGQAVVVAKIELFHEHDKLLFAKGPE